MSPPPDREQHLPGRARAGAVALAGVLALVPISAAVFSSFGLSEGTPRLLGPATALSRLVEGTGLAALYVLAGVGLAGLGSRAWRGADRPGLLQVILGAAAMPWVSHLLGSLGLLSGPTGQWIAWAVIALGLTLLVLQALRARRREMPRQPRGGDRLALMLWAPGAVAAGLMLAAASNPPGVLWKSEFGGFDALSYHLPLAQEWARGEGGLLGAGRVGVLEHSVYSALPSAAETSFLHLGAMLGAHASGAGEPAGLLAFGGMGLIAASMLHALMGLASAAGIAGVTAALLARSGDRDSAAGSAGTARPTLRERGPEAARRILPPLAGSLFLATPWVIVVGSLAYNELFVTAALSAGMLACVDRGLTSARRSLLAGAAVGLACCAKPTALFIGGPTVAALLLVMPARERPGHEVTLIKEAVLRIVPGLAAGLVTLAPWLVRNFIDTGNPVFPAAAGVFGTGHWTAEQAARYASAHRFDGTVVERVSTGLGAARGVVHAQWLALWPTALAAGVILLARGGDLRRPALALALGLGAGLAAWLAITHIQARFLLPLAPTAAVMIALAASRPGLRGGAVAMGTLVAVQATASAAIFAAQNQGRPNALLVGGPDAMTGEIYRQAYLTASEGERRAFVESAPPEVFVNVALRGPGGERPRVYLLGDSTPLYFLGPITYHTTYDRSPIGAAIRAHPDDPGAWWGVLQEQFGIDLALVNLSEVMRLSRDGWYDPEVTPDRVRTWVERHSAVVWAWEGTGRVLVGPKGDGTGRR